MTALIDRESLVAFLWLLGAVVTDMGAIYALVCSHGFRRLPWAGASIVAIFLSFFCLRHSVLVIPLAVAYALWCVFGIFGTLLLGRLFFGQRLSRAQGIGVALLTLGVLCMSLS